MTDARLEAAAEALWNSARNLAPSEDKHTFPPWAEIDDITRQTYRLHARAMLAATDACALAQAEGVARELREITEQWLPHEGITETLLQAALLLTTQAAELERLRALLARYQREESAQHQPQEAGS